MRTRDNIAWAFHMLCGLILIYSGILHAWNPLYFAHNAAAYGILPFAGIVFVATILPYVQILLGLCLIFVPQPSSRFWSVGSSLLLLSFFLFQLKVLVSGESISCGCFGFASHHISWQSALIPLALGLGLAVTAAIPNQVPAALK